MNDHDCNHIFLLLSEYLDRELPPATCEELEEHLRGCPECIEFVQSLKRSVKLCRQFGNCPPAPQPAPQVAAETMANLRRAYREMLARRRASQATSSAS